MTHRTALIVGAGIGGLAAAIALQRAGWTVRVVERGVSPRELGFALLLAPNAMHALRALGVADTVRNGGSIITSGEMRRPDGRILRRLETSSFRTILGEDTVCVLRPVLHGALLDAVGGGTLELASTVTGFTPTADGVELLLTDGRSLRAHIVVGADGVRSVIRRQLHPGEPPPRASGLLALRGVAHDAGPGLGVAGGAQYFGRGLEAGVTRAGPRHVYWYVSLPARDFPAESREPSAIARRVAGSFHEPFRAMIDATRPDDFRIDELFDREPAPKWGDGPVTLLGDAAHPMLPHAGQGAAQALEDAVALGRALAPAGSPPSIDAALRRYEAVRTRRTAAVVRVSRRNARLGSLDGPASCWLRDLAIRLVPTSFILRSLVDLGRPQDTGTQLDSRPEQG